MARITLVTGVLVAFSSCATAQALDYEVYKTKVQPVFLQKREGHARCVVCHAGATNSFRLEKLNAGSSTWTEEQSKKNFEMVVRLVSPGKPETSLLLYRPLAHDGGGAEFHSGGRQFATRSDPAWVAIANWVRGQK